MCRLGRSARIVRSSWLFGGGLVDKKFVGKILALASTRDRLDYEEKTFSVTVNQLMGDLGAVGVRYRMSEAELGQRLSGTSGQLRSRVEATLHQVWMYALVNHDSGLFAQADAVWNQQSNRDYPSDLPGDEFWQFNLHAGIRLFQRQAEWRVSLLNVGDQDYRLNPLNLTSGLPRERTLASSLRISF